MMSVSCVAIFWVINASSDEKSCLQFSIPTESGADGEGGVSHALKRRLNTIEFTWVQQRQHHKAQESARERMSQY